MYQIIRTKSRITLNLYTISMGDDLCVVITGGERPHLGAVALSLVRPSISSPLEDSASTSILTVIGHKEDEIVRKAGHALASKLGKNVVVSCGVHIDNITGEEIITVNNIIDEMIEELILRFNA